MHLLGQHGNMVKELAVVLVRTIVLYLLALAVLRVAGKRTLGKLDTFDFVVAISIGSAIAIGMEADNKLLPSMLPVVLLGALQWAQTALNRKSPGIETITRGRTIPLVKQGKVVNHAMATERITHDDLMMELRQKGFERLEDVKEACLEPTGKVSVLPTTEARPLTMADIDSVAQAVVKALGKAGQQGGKAGGEKQGG